MANLEDDAQIVAFRGAYERGRLVMAVKRAAPLLALVGMAMLVDGVRAVTVAAAAPLLALAIAMHWKSARHGGAVIPGLAVGMIPLTAMRTAQSFGHACVPGACYAVCIPVCVASGVVAGVVGLATLGYVLLAPKEQRRMGVMVMPSMAAGYGGLSVVGAW